MKYVIDMRTLAVVNIELDDTNLKDQALLYEIKTTTGRKLPSVIKEQLMNEEVRY